MCETVHMMVAGEYRVDQMLCFNLLEERLIKQPNTLFQALAFTLVIETEPEVSQKLEVARVRIIRIKNRLTD